MGRPSARQRSSHCVKRPAPVTQERNLYERKAKCSGKKRAVYLLLTLISLCVLMSFLSDKFLTLNNFKNILRQCSQYAICAIGMTMLILLGGIDLSVGSVQGPGSVTAVYVLNMTQNVFLGILAGVLVGAAVGLMNSLIITKMNISPLICTLGTSSVISGTALVLTNAASVQSTVPAYSQIGVGHVLGVPVPVILLVILVGVFYYVLRHTVFGRYIYAIGGNKESAKLTGIPVNRVICIAYIIFRLSDRTFCGDPQLPDGFRSALCWHWL